MAISSLPRGFDQSPLGDIAATPFYGVLRRYGPRQAYPECIAEGEHSAFGQCGQPAFVPLAIGRMLARQTVRSRDFVADKAAKLQKLAHTDALRKALTAQGISLIDLWPRQI